MVVCRDSAANLYLIIVSAGSVVTDRRTAACNFVNTSVNVIDSLAYNAIGHGYVGAEFAYDKYKTAVVTFNCIVHGVVPLYC